MDDATDIGIQIPRVAVTRLETNSETGCFETHGQGFWLYHMLRDLKARQTHNVIVQDNVDDPSKKAVTRQG